MSKTVIVFHVLRNYPPSNLNRDDKGNPKNTNFGGVQRGRISSQSIKRAFRVSEAFDNFRDTGRLDIRTRALPALVNDELMRRGITEEVRKEIPSRIHELGRKEKEKEVEVSNEMTTKQLVRCAPTTVSALVDQLLALRETPKWKSHLENVIEKVNVYGVDTALFGSMTTSAAFPSVDSACQVNHPFSVNQTRWMVDYFTAVDDLSGDSAMIGESPFNSNCYYLAIAVHVDTLLENLQGDKATAIAAIDALIDAIYTAHPSGKQSTFFAMPPASLVIAEERYATAMDYSNAFEVPIVADESGSLVMNAITALSEYVGKVDAMYSPKCNRVFTALQPAEIPNALRANTIEGLKTWVAQCL